MPRSLKKGPFVDDHLLVKVSEMNTGTCLRPSWTAIVWPIMSGTIVDRRDQVLTTFFSLRSFMPAIFTMRCSSTNGPFFTDLVISHAPSRGAG